MACAVGELIRGYLAVVNEPPNRAATPLAGVRPSPVGQIVALSGSERVYARHQWCRRLDMASDQCGVGVSGLWWVSDILRGMSLDGLVAQVGQVLGDARSLYGAAPQGGGWSSTQALSAGRDGIATAGGVVAGWGGAASSTHLAASGGRVLALDNVIGADGATGSGFGGAADTSQSGRNGMTGVVDDTRRGVAAIAPSTDTAAGKRQLVDHLQLELDRAKSLLKILLDELVDADAVTEICVTLAPKLAASQPVGRRAAPSPLALPISMRLEHALVYDDYLFLKYRR